LLKFARRHGVKTSLLASSRVKELIPCEGAITFSDKVDMDAFNRGRRADVFVNFVSLDDSLGKAKLMHKINYQSRHPIEDYAVYSNAHPDCPNPPEWLLHYDNRSHVFGWWRYIKTMLEGVDMGDKEKLSPIIGEPMEYQRKVSLDGLLAYGEGKLGYLDLEKGKLVIGDLNEDDIAWLWSVMWQPL